MRAMLVAAFLTAGCLHARGPANGAAKADAATLRTFEILVNDNTKIKEAAEFAKAKGLRREDWIGPADRAYWSFVRAGVYPPAAEIAWRFRFGAPAIGLALEFQRRDADKATAAYVALKKRPDERVKLYAAIWELTLEMRIACRYGPTAEAAEETIDRALALKALSNVDDVLYPLLDEGCPVEPPLRASIIDTALLEDKDDYAIRHGAASGWDDVRTSQFLWHFFYYGDCTDGVRALVAFRVPDKSSARIIESANCESEIIDSRKWGIAPGTANGWFFAAVRGRKFNLALELLPHGTHGEDGRTYLYQEAIRGGHEYALMDALAKHPSFHDPFMAYVWERGRYRFIANFSTTLVWQRKAFDKLIELKQWDFAAEAAQYGASESLRTEGILIAFRAAMADGDFKAGRYFVARYGPGKTSEGLVTQEMYDEEKDKWYAARQAGSDPEWMKESEPKPKPKAKRKKKRKPRKNCPDDDWCP